MKDWRRLALAGGIAAALALVSAAFAKDEEGDEDAADWQKFSACAGALRVNPTAAGADARAMQTQADAYESAAARAHRKERSSSPSTARQEVRDLVTSNIRNFSRKETAAVAGFIDACPTLEAE